MIVRPIKQLSQTWLYTSYTINGYERHTMEYPTEHLQAFSSKHMSLRRVSLQENTSDRCDIISLCASRKHCITYLSHTIEYTLPNLKCQRNS